MTLQQPHSGSSDIQQIMKQVNGTLYLVGTPIGNLEDITMRALRILKEVDLIAAEDTRHTGKLLHYFHIKTPQISCHEHNEQQKIPEILEKLQSGKSIALNLLRGGVDPTIIASAIGLSPEEIQQLQ